ncbi:MAG: fluoride efflux transporter CrcB [Bacillota bacterium]
MGAYFYNREAMKIIYLYIGAGGFLGAILRYALGQAITHLWTGNYPLGTFLINLTGCFILGLFLTLTFEWLSVGPNLRLGIATGLLGAFTTFSTFTFEVLGLLDRGLPGLAVGYAVLSMLLGLCTIWLGHIAARTLQLIFARIGTPTNETMDN